MLLPRKANITPCWNSYISSLEENYCNVLPRLLEYIGQQKDKLLFYLLIMKLCIVIYLSNCTKCDRVVHHRGCVQLYLFKGKQNIYAVTFKFMNQDCKITPGRKIDTDQTVDILKWCLNHAWIMFEACLNKIWIMHAWMLLESWLNKGVIMPESYLNDAEIMSDLEI